MIHGTDTRFVPPPGSHPASATLVIKIPPFVGDPSQNATATFVTATSPLFLTTADSVTVLKGIKLVPLIDRSPGNNARSLLRARLVTIRSTCPGCGTLLMVMLTLLDKVSVLFVRLMATLL